MYPPSPVPSDANLWPGEKPFTAFGQFGVDSIDLRVFDQDAYWVDHLGNPHRLEEMRDSYRENVVEFLVQRAGRFFVDSCLRTVLQAEGDARLGRVNGDVLLAIGGGPVITDLDAAVWLEATPLMRRLRKLAASP